MSENLTRLRRPVEPIRHPEQVALLRAALERLGYTASDEDIQAAHGEWSEDMWAASWFSIDESQADFRAQWLVEMNYLEPAE